MSNRIKNTKDRWEGNRKKIYECLKRRAEEDFCLSPHLSEIQRQYNYKLRKTTTPAAFRNIIGLVSDFFVKICIEKRRILNIVTQ